MPGLFADALPWAYSTGNMLQRRLSGLLSDPMGTAQQAMGQAGDSANKLRGLLDQAYADPKSFMPTNQNALAQLLDATMQGPMGFAPAGITAWHGSPHTFDSFNHQANLGKGDGFQQQGIGTYLADNQEVAKVYSKGGNVYKVDLPDEALPSMLDFGAPIMSQRHLGKQLNAIHEANPSLKDAFFSAARNNEPGEVLFLSVLQQRARDLKAQGFKGNVYEEANRQATQIFRDAGIAGFKYPDKGSRGGTGGTNNYVVFDDSALRILERNGSPLQAK